MSCKLCQEFRKKYPLKNGKHVIIKDEPTLSMSPIKCAFEKKEFSINNWNCETCNALRDLIEEHGYRDRDDLRSASIGVLRIPESDKNYIQQGYVVLSWYKNRGRIGRAYVLWDDSPIEILTLRTAELIIDKYKLSETIFPK